MAQRLDLRSRGLQAAGLRPARHTPDLGLFDEIFKPGMLYSGFPAGSSQNMPLQSGALGLLKSGGRAGLTAFDQLFDQAGRVADPMGLLRTLNAGNVLWNRPTVGNGSKYGLSPQGFNPLMGAPQQHAYNQSRGLNGGGPRGDLMNWIASLGQQGGAGAGFDPTQIRYDNYRLAPGVNLLNANRQDLENWAKETYGVDLLTLAASPTALLEARQKYMADPNQLFDPENPGMLRKTAIPGLDPETSAGRLGAYSQAWSSLQDEAARQRESRLGGQLTELLRSNPEAMRTGFGRQLGLTADYAGAASRAATGLAPQPWDYSLQYQSALLPEMINRAIQSALGGF